MQCEEMVEKTVFTDIRVLKVSDISVGDLPYRTWKKLRLPSPITFSALSTCTREMCHSYLACKKV
jgi:hypothetical protein